MGATGLFNVLSNEGFSLCGAFSHDAMAANDTGQFRNNETTPMLAFETNPVKAFFCSNNLHRCWSRE